MCDSEAEERRIALCKGVESGILGIGIRIPEYSSRTPESINDWNPESKFYRQRIRNPVPGVQNARREIQNPRLSWIPLHGARRTETRGRDAIRNFYDADGNKNVKKKQTNKQTIGLISKTTFHVHYPFLYISLPALHDYDVKMPNFVFYGARKQATTKFCFSFRTWIYINYGLDDQ